MFKNLIESDEAEAARLAKAPVGSKSRALSMLPVNIREWPRGMVIELPWEDGKHIVVVPYRYDKVSAEPKGSDDELSRAEPVRQDGYWAVIVVESNQPSYSVGGHDLSVSFAEIRRGKRVTSFSHGN